MIKRNTIQCAMTLRAVNELRDHATADEVYFLIAKESPTISKGTVYRNLNRLAQTGQIRKVTVPGGAERFDHRCDEHYHVRCDRCARVFDVDMPPITDMEKQIKDAHGFRFTGYDIMFRGICPECGRQAAFAHETLMRERKNNP